VAGIKFIDRGWTRIQKMLRQTKHRAAKTGIQGKLAAAATPEHGGMSNVALGVIHEFGTTDDAGTTIIPERSFIRSTYNENLKKYQKRIDALAKLLAQGIDIEGELLLLGEEFRADIIKKIHSNIPPPLDPATIARKKGEETALIDTGQLINSLTTEVVDGS
jgi:phage gpG-like protein